MPKNYYLILGVSETADWADIRDAYRRLAKRYHPDRCMGDPHLFLEIHEAYEMLSDLESRSSYDEQLKKAREGPRKMRVFAEPWRPRRRASSVVPRPSRPPTSTPYPAVADIHELGTFEEDWFWAPWWEQFPGETEPLRPEVDEGEIILSPEDAEKGGQVSLRIPASRICPSCRGFGEFGLYSCGLCSGSGVIDHEIPLTLEFPPGIADGHLFRMSLAAYGYPGTPSSEIIGFLQNDPRAAGAGNRASLPRNGSWIRGGRARLHGGRSGRR